MDTTPMTKSGHKQLQEELNRLKTVDRPNVIAAISEARAHGDLKENAEYHAAKEQQSFIEGRIREVESKLSQCQVIDISQIENNGKVIFGATVKLLNTDNDQEVTYQIVGEDESNVKENKISVVSPIARALIGKHVDDEVIVHTPKGETAYEILQVDYV